MYQLLIGAIIAIACIFLFLTLIIIGNKIWLDGRARWQSKRRLQLEPRVEVYARAAEISVHQIVGPKLRWRDREVLEEILLRLAQRVTGDQRDRLSRALVHFGYVEQYLSRLKSNDWWHRADAAEKLGQTGTRRGIDALVAALDDEVPEVRLRAAKALGELGGSAAVRALIRALSKPNRWSTIRIAGILATRGPEVVSDLESAYDGLNLDARLAVLDILSDIGDERATTWMHALLDDHDVNVRSRAANALRAIGDNASGSHLTKLLTDPEWPVRAMAANALGAIRYQPAIESLCSTLRDPVWWVRANSAEALQMMGPEGLEALEHMLDDADTFARHRAVLILQATGTLDRRISGVVNAEPEVRTAARVLVKRMIADGQIGHLQDLADNDPDPELRAQLIALLSADIDPDPELHAQLVTLLSDELPKRSVTI